MDVKKIGKIPDGGGWKAHGRQMGSTAARKRARIGYDYVHSLVDDHSRLAYSEVLPDEKGATCAAFLLRAAASFADHGITRIERVITDNHFSYRKSTDMKNAKLFDLGAQTLDLLLQLLDLGRAARRIHRRELRAVTEADQVGESVVDRDVEHLITEGPFTVEEMCSECATPMAHHGWVWPSGSPCPVWPGWATRMREVRQLLETFANHREAEAVSTPKPKAQPLAAFASGLPIADAVARLSELQQQFPDAEVRRGRASRWELWAPDEAE